MSLKLLNSRDIEGRFYELLETREMPEWIQAITWLNRTNKAEEIYRFLGFGPKMSKHTGDREAEKVPVTDITVKNDVYDASMYVGKDEYRRDLTGQIDVRIQELSDEPNNHTEELVTDAIEQGASSSSEFGLAYDDQPFFSANHQWDESPTQSNINTFSGLSSATDPTPAEIKSIVLVALQRMKQLKDNKNRPINRMMRDIRVVIPTNMWANAIEAFGSPVLYNGTAPVTNTLQAVQSDGMNLRLIENAWATSQNKIRVFRADGRLAPIIRQVEVEPMLETLDESSDHYKKFRETVHTVEGIHGVGYGRWEYAFEATTAA